MNTLSINESFKKAKSENRPALVTYTVAGDNTKKKSLEILKSISSKAKRATYCLIIAFLGSVKIARNVFSSRESMCVNTGKRPMISGINPNAFKSDGTR